MRITACVGRWKMKLRGGVILYVEPLFYRWCRLRVPVDDARSSPNGEEAKYLNGGKSFYSKKLFRAKNSSCLFITGDVSAGKER